MPDILKLPRLAAFFLLAAGLPAGQALAQNGPPMGMPQPGQMTSSNPICVRLEGQLAIIDRGGGDAVRADQLRRYEESAGRQQAELDRVTARARQMGCDSSGFFSLFNAPSAQCGPVNNQIQQMRANLERIVTSLEQLRGGQGNMERDNQRRSVIQALAQNNCGPQYAAAARQSGGGFFDNLFGGGNRGESVTEPAVDPSLQAQSGTYRTVCVRTCDGFYFPISFATVPGRFADDERTCKAQCPAADATLFTYRNPGEDMNSAVSINGQPYTSLANAFRYRQEYNPSCSCKAAGETWADALKNVDDKAAVQQQGDIIVTEESARRMSQPASVKSSGKKRGAADTTAAPPAPATTAPSATAPTPATSEGASGQIRSVGPTFLPNR